MSIPPVAGHHDLKRDLLAAHAAGRLPQVMLLTGPSGVGKTRLALWLAQRLVCEAPAGTEPCGRCAGCIKVQGLAHPDVHLFVPIPRPKAGDADKQVEEAAEMLEEAIAARRANPVAAHPHDGLANHGVATARLIQRRASLTSSEGGWRVFIISRAERLVPQESSQEAANALLKLLEEPPARSMFIMTTAEPGQVLPTIRSRAVPVRVNRITDDELASFLATHAGKPASAETAARAHGSIGMALAGGGGKDAAAAAELLRAIRQGPGRVAERSLRQQPWAARGDFTAMLDELAELLSREAREQAGDGRQAMRRAAAIERVLQAREQASGNVNPQLLLCALANDLASLEAA